MATIHSLISRGLVEIKMPLERRERQKRWLYGVPEFEEWLREALPNLTPGRLGAADSPMEQVDFRLHQWIAGEEIRYERHLKDLMPVGDEIWEFKTADVRIFGWIYRPNVFIAVLGEYADLFKSRSKTKNYGDAVKAVKMARDRLPLDEPKFWGGKFDELVSV